MIFASKALKSGTIYNERYEYLLKNRDSRDIIPMAYYILDHLANTEPYSIRYLDENNEICTMEPDVTTEEESD